jgi:hypothetical protein
MKKVDLKKELRHLYSPSAKEAQTLEVPEMTFLMIDGQGDPNTSKQYRDSLEALYGLSYTLKFMIKKGKIAVDYGVMPLEGLWWADNMSNFIAGNKDAWKWTSMIMQPQFVTDDLVRQAIEHVTKKKSLPSLSKVRFESFREGLSAQIMHIGPYAVEEPTIKRLHSFIKENGYELRGKHHEIYLSDPRKSAPEKMRTIIRHPIAPVK